MPNGMIENIDVACVISANKCISWEANRGDNRIEVMEIIPINKS